MRKGALNSSFLCVCAGQDRVESYSGRKFVYDGLYDVKEVKQEKGTQGFTVVKFLLWRQARPSYPLSTPFVWGKGY